jgi:hypothetical protein
MANNGPISVSAPNKNLLGAVSKDITFNTRYPFAKIDSTKPISFRVINLLFSTDPPNPDGTISTYQRDLIYTFAHGYSYVPSTWHLVSLNGFTTAVGSEGYFLTGGGDFGTFLGAAVLIITVDSTNVNIYVDKYYATGNPGLPSIFGFTLAIRSYIFINDLSGTDVPTSA